MAKEASRVQSVWAVSSCSKGPTEKKGHESCTQKLRAKAFPEFITQNLRESKKPSVYSQVRK